MVSEYDTAREAREKIGIYNYKSSKIRAKHVKQPHFGQLSGFRHPPCYNQTFQRITGLNAPPDSNLA